MTVVLQDGRQLDGRLVPFDAAWQVAGVRFEEWEIDDLLDA